MPPRAAPLTDAIVGINVTPFVDVALVLLIIVMVAARAASTAQAIPFQPPIYPHTMAAPPPAVVVSIDVTGQAYLGTRPVTDAALAATLRAAPPERLIVIAHPRVAHGRVVRVLDLTRAAGVTRFTLQALLAEGAAP